MPATPLTTDDLLPPFQNRAAAEAANVANTVRTLTVASRDILLHYIRDTAGTALTTADGAKWSPAGDVYPDHWEENTTPGTTDMTTALNSSSAFGGFIRLFPSRYLVSDGIVFSGHATGLIGAGSERTFVETLRNDIDIISFDHPSENRVLEPQVTGVTIRYRGTGRKLSGAHIRGVKTVLRAYFEDIEFENVYDGFHFNGVQGWIRNCYLTQPRYLPGERGRFGFNFETVGEAAKAYDLHISNCDIFAQLSGLNESGLEAAVRINVCDGIYFTTCHFQGTESHWLINPTGAEKDSTVASILATNCYFDTSFGSHVTFTGSTNQRRYRNIFFTGCQFRDAKGSLGSIVIDAAVERLGITGGTIRDSARNGIVTTPNGVTAKAVTVTGVQFVGNNVGVPGSAAAGDITYGGDGMNATGNTFVAGGPSGHAISFLASANNCEEASNNIAESTAAQGIKDAGVDNWHDSLRNASGIGFEYRKHKDGWLEIQATIAIPPAPTADTSWVFPHAFASGVDPNVTGTVANGPGATPVPHIFNLSGGPSNTAVGFNVFNVSGARVGSITARLRATGRWK